MKISLRTLMLWVAFIAVVTAALAQPSLFWMRVMFTLSIAFLLYVAAGALAARGQARSFWIGAAVFGSGYFVMLMDGRMIDFHQQASMLPRALITQHVLDILAEARGLHVRSGYGDFKLWDPSIYQGIGGSPFGSGTPAMPGSGTMPAGRGFFDVDPEALDEPASGGSAGSPAAPGAGDASGSMGPPPGMSSPGGSGMGAPGMGSGSGSGMAGAPPLPTPWTYTSYNHFLITGHCAFLIVIGLAGGMLCRWTFGREEERPPR